MFVYLRNATGRWRRWRGLIAFENKQEYFYISISYVVFVILFNYLPITIAMGHGWEH